MRKPPDASNASGPNERIQTYIHPTLFRRLQREARATGRTDSEQAAAAIEFGMSDVRVFEPGRRRTPFKDRVAELMRGGNKRAKARAIAEAERGWSR